MAEGQNVTRTIVNHLGARIVRGDWDNVSSFPVEAELCQEYSASRSVLREAVKMLSAKGLLSARPRRGTSVEPEENWNILDPDVLRWMLERKSDARLMLEFTEVRMAIEPYAAQLAALYASDEQIAEIGAALDRMRAAGNGEDDPLESDIAFHVAILNASNNRFYSEFAHFVETALRYSIRMTNELKGVHVADVGNHEKVYQAISEKNAENSTEHMLSMLVSARELLRKLALEMQAN